MNIFRSNLLNLEEYSMAEKHCSFCGKPYSQTGALVAGPNDIYMRRMY